MKNIIEKQLELYNEFMIKGSYAKAIYKFYCAYLLSINILDIKLNDKKVNFINYLWRNILYKNKINGQHFKKIKEIMTNDMIYIIKAVNLLEKLSSETKYEDLNFCKIDYVGMLSWEFPD